MYRKYEYSYNPIYIKQKENIYLNKDDNKYYYSDETGWLCGPYNTQEDAERELKQYCDFYL